MLLVVNILKNLYPYLTKSPILSTSPNLSTLSSPDIFPLSINTLDCNSGASIIFNNASFFVIAEETNQSDVIPEDSTIKIVVPSL